jgi:signal transduction histidine kinase
VPAESGIDVLVQFARLASEARTGNGILPRLADALVAHSDAAAVAVLEIRPGGEAALVNSPHLPKELVGLRVDADTIGEELGGRLLATCQGRFQGVRAHPLVGASRLFGMVVLFFHSQGPPEQLPLAEGLIDLAAIVLGSAVQVQDLTRSHAELRASQETLVRTEKLRALGQMAAGVSHDLKNILNPLSLHIEVIARAIARGSTAEAQDNVAQIKQVLRRGVQTVERFQDYGRQSPESRSEQIDLNHLVSEAADIARPRMASHGPRLHHLREELGSPAVVLGRSEEILSALVNLIVNAIDAIPAGVAPLPCAPAFLARGAGWKSPTMAQASRRKSNSEYSSLFSPPKAKRGRGSGWRRSMPACNGTAARWSSRPPLARARLSDCGSQALRHRVENADWSVRTAKHRFPRTHDIS